MEVEAALYQYQIHATESSTRELIEVLALASPSLCTN